MAIVHSNLRDLLRINEESDGNLRLSSEHLCERKQTLASILDNEKSRRTLYDFINEDQRLNNHNQSWNSLTNQLHIRCDAVITASSSVTSIPEIPSQPNRMSLMALMEQTDQFVPHSLPRHPSLSEELEEGIMDYICCVCMVRNKGAACIPCGHTFCRLCCREVWLSRGNCPLCNGPILEILNIF